MRDKPRQRDELRGRIAHEAARTMLELGIGDYGHAKRKAAERFGVSDERALPSNGEIEQALREYQRLFRADTQPRVLRRLREAALEGLHFFADFEPRLVGPVLEGTADEHSAIALHAYCDDAGAVREHLLTHGVEFDEGHRRVRLDRERAEDHTVYRFDAGDAPVELTVLPRALLRQAPLDPVDEKPMRRATAAQVRALLDEGEGPGPRA